MYIHTYIYMHRERDISVSKVHNLGMLRHATSLYLNGIAIDFMEWDTNWSADI